MKKLLTLLLIASTVCTQALAQRISEFEPNPTGGDPQNVSFEISGTPGQAFDLWILSIEGDVSSSSNPGVIDQADNITGTFNANGLFVATIMDFENPSFTVLMAPDFTGTVGTTDIDSDDDGIVDNTADFTGAFLDAIGVPDDASSTTTKLYGSQLNGADFAYTGDEPQLIFRDGVTGAWYAINDPAGTEALDIDDTAVPFTDFNVDPSVKTFGAFNPTTAPPCSLSDLQVSSIVCSGDDAKVTGSFVAANGSGAYNIAVTGDATYTVSFEGLPNGTVPFEFTIAGPLSGTVNITATLLNSPLDCAATLSDVVLPTCPAVVTPPVAAIPTMGQWALFILALMISSLALGFMVSSKRSLIG